MSERPTSHFSDRLAAAIDRCGSPACVGLDPVFDKLPAALRAGRSAPARAISDFCEAVIDAAAPHVAAIKFQSACFERYGAEGLAPLPALFARAKAAGLVTILDAKRGDIGVTADHYNAAAFDHYSADALTISAYLGPDTIEPFLRPDRGVFVLVRTSNPGSDAVQGQQLADGRTVAQMLADLVSQAGKTRKGSCGLSDVGAVVGATKSAEAAALRARMPDQILLVPGYGAQGGTLEDIRPMLRPGRGGARTPAEMGVIVTASRSVIYAFGLTDADWRRSVAAASESFAKELRSLKS